MSNDESPTVIGVWQDGCVLIQCSQCGPLGVSPSGEIAKVVSAAHMRVKHLITWVIQT